MNVSIVNKTMELADCRDQWFFDEKHGCWCLEDVIYTPVPKVPAFQRLSIYAPKDLMNLDGTPAEKAGNTPVAFSIKQGDSGINDGSPSFQHPVSMRH